MNLKELKERFERRLLDEKEIKFLFSKVEEMQEAFSIIHGIASETFESCNQLELIRLTAVEHLKGADK